MKSEIQRILENANKERDGSDHFKLLSYSGRGMYGESCLGVVVDNGHICEMIASLVRGAPDEEGRREDLSIEIESMRQDSMGMDTIFYFTRSVYTEHKGDEDGDKEDTDCCVSYVMQRFKHVTNAEDLKLIEADARYKITHGWSTSDVITYISCMEEAESRMPDDEAIAKMKALAKKYE